MPWSSQQEKKSKTFSRLKETEGGAAAVCEVMRQYEEQAWQRGIQQGMQKGQRSIIFSMIQDGDISMEKGAAKLNLTVEMLKEEMKRAGYTDSGC